MLIRVRLFGELREYMKDTPVTLEILEGSTVRDFILEMSKIRRPFSQKLMTNNALRPEFKIMVNGRDIDFLRKMETELKDRDMVSILPVAGGGGPVNQRMS
jgi:molybdopterin synthase sulfur carrier subunit